MQIEISEACQELLADIVQVRRYLTEMQDEGLTDETAGQFSESLDRLRGLEMQFGRRVVSEHTGVY